MRVDAIFVPAMESASLTAKDVCSVRFAININDAERARIEKARLRPGEPARDGGSSEYDALLDFMAAAAEVFDGEH